MNEIGNKIKNLREMNGISANKLAQLLSIDPSTISKIENGVSRPSLDLLMKICNYFQIGMSDFFSDGINTVILPNNIKELLNNAKNLTPEQIKSINNLIEAFNSKK